ncbi:MAG: hypothetical protein GXP63_02250 [DPANN group archaeon]|nr:hypothetical protein [DPANN group archaeon]
MNKMNRHIRQGIILLGLLLVLVQSVLAMGIVPSSREIIFQPSKAETVKVKIINNDGFPYDALIYVDGPLKPYITLHDELISFGEGETEKIISYTLNMPASMKQQGQIDSEIIVRQIPKRSSASGSRVTASIAVSHKVKLKVPFTGKYAEAKLFVGNFKEGKPSNFAVEVTNLGTEDLLSVNVLIDIYGPLNNKLAALRSDEVSIASKGTRVISVPWTPKLGSGIYHARATVVYDEKNAEDEKSFTIGEPTVSVDSISVDNFKLGGIAKFAIAISSNWNLPIDEIFAKTTVKDSSGKIHSQYKTATTYMDPFGKQVIDAFWDTSKVLAGTYLMEIDLTYLQKTSRKVFNIFVDNDRISTSPTGQVTGKAEGKSSPILQATYILMFLVFGLIIFNVFMFRRLKRKS